jgi:hypothetical protein
MCDRIENAGMSGNGEGIRSKQLVKSENICVKKYTVHDINELIFFAGRLITYNIVIYSLKPPGRAWHASCNQVQ